VPERCSLVGLGRDGTTNRFIGIDTEPKYLNLSVKRFADLAKNLKNRNKLEGWE